MRTFVLQPFLNVVFGPCRCWKRIHHALVVFGSVHVNNGRTKRVAQRSANLFKPMLEKVSVEIAMVIKSFTFGGLVGGCPHFQGVVDERASQLSTVTPDNAGCNSANSAA